MKTCVYFAENRKIPASGGRPPAPPPETAGKLRLGYGFTAAGLWRELPLPEPGAGLVADDRFLPNSRGLEAARRVLEAWDGLILLDLERPPQPGLAGLIRDLEGKRLILPPAYGALPHAGVLVGPWRGDRPFLRWLEACRARWGTLFLDAAPLRCRARPGSPLLPWEGALPEEGFPCPGLGCLHRRLEDGSVLFWDSRRSLMERLEPTGVPAVVLASEWQALPEK